MRDTTSWVTETLEDLRAYCREQGLPGSATAIQCAISTLEAEQERNASEARDKRPSAQIHDLASFRDATVKQAANG